MYIFFTLKQYTNRTHMHTQTQKYTNFCYTIITHTHTYIYKYICISIERECRVVENTKYKTKYTINISRTIAFSSRFRT